MSITKICINLWILNILVAISLHALHTASLLPVSYVQQVPSLATLDQLVNKAKVSDAEVNPSLIFGDFIYALRFVASIIMGENLAYLLSLSNSVTFVSYFIYAIYILSTSLFVIKIVSNRHID